MALLLVDCADNCVIRTSAITGTPPIADRFYASDRGGDCYVFGAPGALYYTIPPRSEIFVRFAFTWSEANNHILDSSFLWLLSAGYTVATITFRNVTKSFEFKIGQTIVLDASSPDAKVFRTDGFYDIDMRFKFDVTNGIFETRYGGNWFSDYQDYQGGFGTICFAGNTIPAGTTISTIDQVCLGSTAAGTTLSIGNIFINDTLGSSENNFLHGYYTGAFHADVWDEGSYDQWMYKGSHYKGSTQMWKDGAYIYTRQCGKIDSYATDDPGGWDYYVSMYSDPPDPSPFHIVALETVATAKRSNPGLATSLQHALVMGATWCDICDYWYAHPEAGTVYLSPQEHTLTTDYKPYASLWPYDPSTGKEWGPMDGYYDVVGGRMFQLGVRSWIVGYVEAKPELLHLNTDFIYNAIALIDGVANETIPISTLPTLLTSHKVAACAVPVTTINEALNCDILEFELGGNYTYNWKPTSEPSLIAMQSGAVTTNKNCYIIANVTGPGTINFWWAVDSQQYNGNLELWVDNSKQTTISGPHETLVWSNKSYVLEEGRHEVAWNYIKDSSSVVGRDAGFLRDVDWSGSQNWLQTDSTFNVAAGSTALKFVLGGDELWDVTTEPGVTAVQSGDMTYINSTSQESFFTTTVVGPGYIDFWWAVDTTNYNYLQFYIDFKKQIEIKGAHTTLTWTYVIYEVGSGIHSFRWQYAKYDEDVGRDAGLVRNIRWSLTEPEPPAPPASFEDAVNNHVLVFTLGGNALWAATDEPGVTAAESGDINNSQTSWFTAPVTGPGTIDFWWAVDSENGYDYLEFYIDTTRQDRIAGQNATLNWIHKTISVSSGSHTLKWNYMKDGSESYGRDAGFVKNIVWTPS